MPGPLYAKSLSVGVEGVAVAERAAELTTELDTLLRPVLSAGWHAEPLDFASYGTGLLAAAKLGGPDKELALIISALASLSRKEPWLRFAIGFDDGPATFELKAGRYSPPGPIAEFLAVADRPQERAPPERGGELVAALGLKPEPGFFYHIDRTDVFRTSMARPGRPPVREKVSSGGFVREPGWFYFLDKEGNIRRRK